MPTLRQELAADMANGIAGYEQTFEWNGREGIPCVRRDQPTVMELQEEAGMIEHVQFWLLVAKAAFPDGSFPGNGDPVNEHAHQIKSVKGDKDAAAVQLVLAIGSFDE